MNSNKVWLIGSGEYSDYRIFGACSSLEKAQALVAHLNEHVKSRYTEYRVDDENGIEIDNMMEYIHSDLRPYEVCIRLLNGDILYSRVGNYEDFEPVERMNWESTQEENYRRVGYARCLFLRVWAKNLDHASQIAAERRRATLTDPAYVPIPLNYFPLHYGLADGE